MFQVYSRVIQLYIYILFQILFHYRLLQDTEYCSLCYMVGPCHLFYIQLCVYVNPKLLILSPTPFPQWQLYVCFLCLWVYFCFVNKKELIIIKRLFLYLNGCIRS